MNSAYVIDKFCINMLYFIFNIMYFINSLSLSLFAYDYLNFTKLEWLIGIAK